MPIEKNSSSTSTKTKNLSLIRKVPYSMRTTNAEISKVVHIAPRQLRRRRSLILARGWRAATTLGIKLETTLKGLGGWRTLSGLLTISRVIPRLSRRSSQGLKLANAFGVCSLFLVCAVSVLVSNGLAHSVAEKITSEELIKKHLASIGATEDINASHTRISTGSTQAKLRLTNTAVELSGPAQLASDGDKFLLAMVFQSNNYPHEKVLRWREPDHRSPDSRRAHAARKFS
jgi:hypothetical protein